MITDLVNKFEITKDALNTFKNQAFWKNKLDKMKSGVN